MTFAKLLIGATGSEKPQHPLTHHEILSLIEPFTRRSRRVDLNASDRISRRLIFKPVEHFDEVLPGGEAREILQLENLRPDLYRLTRTLTLSCGLEASLKAEGSNPGELLANIEAVPPPRHFRSGVGYVIALSYQLSTDAGQARRMDLTRGQARIEGLTVSVNSGTVKGYPARLDLVPEAGDLLQLPDDLLAVLGRHWGLLRRDQTGWTGNLRAPSSEPQRSRQIETKLETTAAYLAQTLAEPPRLFHEKLVRARWAVVLRRAAPLLFFASLIAGASGLSFVTIPEQSILHLLILSTPPLLLVSLFGMREMPSLEIPPLPRRSKALAWRQSAEASEPTPPAIPPVPTIGPDTQPAAMNQPTAMKVTIDA
jgi:hypothetical protein